MSNSVKMSGISLSVMMVMFVTGLVENVRASIVDDDGRVAYRAVWIPLAVVAGGAVAMHIWCVTRGYSGYSFGLRRKGWMISVESKCV
jgi:hypothetical protein